ncbi:peptide deformylase [Pontimonas salivibrio]|uniref:Peptide deformylase n=1 Tax=Pontimonas salivibrio TaxID=1159327 RepID=A0A2L2BQ63_9MICO|nr:peptide deformylase [Pontimonas salivibrio]AVG23806.1 peptide deformylase [Pontimonas salivibrio]
MAVLPILTTGTPVLHQRAARVDRVTNDIRALVADMTDTMHEAPGVGLAAPQVGVGLQIFVWRYESDEALHQGHVLNPRLILRGPWKGRFRGEPEEEGCLSIPGFRYPLARAHRARLVGTDLEGHPLDIAARGWLARIFQHEYDHLQGILYRDRLARKWRKEAEIDIAHSDFINTRDSWTPGEDGQESDFVTEFDGAEVDNAEVDNAEVDGAEVDGAEVDGAEVDGAELDELIDDGDNHVRENADPTVDDNSAGSGGPSGTPRDTQV